MELSKLELEQLEVNELFEQLATFNCNLGWLLYDISKTKYRFNNQNYLNIAYGLDQSTIVRYKSPTEYVDIMNLFNRNLFRNIIFEYLDNYFGENFRKSLSVTSLDEIKASGAYNIKTDNEVTELVIAIADTNTDDNMLFIKMDKKTSTVKKNKIQKNKTPIYKNILFIISLKMDISKPVIILMSSVYNVSPEDPKGLLAVYVECLCRKPPFPSPSSEPSRSSVATYPWRDGVATSPRPLWRSAWARLCPPCAAWKRAMCAFPFISLRVHCTSSARSRRWSTCWTRPTTKSVLR